MEEIIYTKGYEQLRAEIKEELANSANSFVKIGYLLKVARDTRVLEQSPYSNMEEFAKQEFGIDKSTASRFMGINDRFSEGGYSERLKTEYKGIGWSKLSVMLQLPDSINEEALNLTKSELNELRGEVAEAQKESPLETILEGETNTTAAVQDNLTKAILQLGESEPNLYTAIHKKVSEKENKPSLKDIKAIMVPNGEKIYSIRIRGVGRIMLSLKDYEETVSMINERTGEKEIKLWDDLMRAWMQYIDIEQLPEENWKIVYGMEYPLKKAEVAPVQQKKEEKKVVKVNEKPKKQEKAKKETSTSPKQQTLNDINKAFPMPEPIQEEPEEEPVENAVEEVEIEGQVNIEDIPGIIPNEEEGYIIETLELAKECVEEKRYTEAIEYLRDCVNRIQTLEEVDG